MPRDSNGNMTLVAGNPVVTDTTISSSWANTTLADLASEIQDSLSRSGKGGMLVSFNFANGTLGNPGITFTNDSTTGVRLNAAGDMRVVVSAADVIKLLTGGIEIPGTLKVDGATTFAGAVTLSSTLTGLTRAALPSVGVVASSGTTTWTTTNIVATDVSGSTITGLTTSSAGRPVYIALVPNDTTTGHVASIGINANGVNALTACQATFLLIRTTGGVDTTISQFVIGAAGASSTALGSYFAPGMINFLDTTAAAGTTYNYRLQAYESLGATSIVSVAYSRLIAYEL